MRSSDCSTREATADPSTRPAEAGLARNDSGRLRMRGIPSPRIGTWGTRAKNSRRSRDSPVPSGRMTRLRLIGSQYVPTLAGKTKAQRGWGTLFLSWQRARARTGCPTLAGPLFFRLGWERTNTEPQACHPAMRHGESRDLRLFFARVPGTHSGTWDTSNLNLPLSFRASPASAGRVEGSAVCSRVEQSLDRIPASNTAP